MQKHHREGESGLTALMTLSPTRVTALLFVLTVSFPIIWGLTAGKARAQERPAYLPTAPETAVELIALAANVPVRSSRGGRKAPEPPPEIVRAAPIPAIQEPPPAETIPPPSEFYAAAEASVEAPTEALGAPRARGVGALAPERPAAETDDSTVETLLAQLDSNPAAALLQQSAPAPQLSEVGASTSRSVLTATASVRAAVRESGEGQSGAGRGTEAPPATQQEVQAARADQTEALSRGGGGGQATRRRAAMHRMAAAAASSLNEATPFRTSGSGPARFSGATAGDSLGAGLDRAAAAISAVPGLQLEDVTLSAGYSSNGLPGARNFYGSQAGNLGSDADFGAKATLAFRKQFRTSSFGLTYTPSRNQRSRFSEWNSTDHVLGLKYDREFGRRWGLALNASAANTGMEQFWFRQPTYRRVENPPTSLEELLQRVEAGEFTDDELASLLTGAPIVDDPGGRELELTRVTSLNSTATASYAHSARTTYTMGLGASQYETSAAGGFRDSTGRVAVNDISRQFAFFQGAYRVDPSLTAGFRYNASRNDSTFGLSHVNAATMFIQKRLNRFWSIQAEGGGGYVDLDRESGLIGALPENFQAPPTWTAGGSVRYRYGGHAFESFARRQVGDNLGLSSRTSLNAGLSWEWATPRMPWVVSGGASYSRSDLGFVFRDDGSNFYETSLLHGGLSRKLSPSTALMLGYYYGRYSSPFSGLLTGTTVHRVQGAFLWRPVVAR